MYRERLCMEQETLAFTFSTWLVSNLVQRITCYNLTRRDPHPQWVHYIIWRNINVYCKTLHGYMHLIDMPSVLTFYHSSNTTSNILLFNQGYLILILFILENFPMLFYRLFVFAYLTMKWKCTFGCKNNQRYRRNTYLMRKWKYMLFMAWKVFKVILFETTCNKVHTL